METGMETSALIDEHAFQVVISREKLVGIHVLLFFWCRLALIFRCDMTEADYLEYSPTRVRS
jgi:hypothetical protein